MNLKEAFRYQKFLDVLVTSGVSYLRDTGNIVRVRKEHLRTAACATAANEIEEATADRVVNATPDQIVSFLETVLREKTILSSEIAAVKSGDFDLDGDLAVNRLRQMLAHGLLGVAKMKPSEKVTRGTGYTFNAEGNQVSYCYDIKQTTTLDFDRDDVRRRANALLSYADDVSGEIEEFMVQTELDYEPPFNVHDSFADAVEEYLSQEVLRAA